MRIGRLARFGAIASSLPLVTQLLAQPALAGKKPLTPKVDDLCIRQALHLKNVVHPLSTLEVLTSRTYNPHNLTEAALIRTLQNVLNFLNIAPLTPSQIINIQQFPTRAVRKANQRIQELLDLEEWKLNQIEKKQAAILRDILSFKDRRTIKDNSDKVTSSLAKALDGLLKNTSDSAGIDCASSRK